MTRVTAKPPFMPLYASAHLIAFINGGIPRKYVNMNMIIRYGGNAPHP